MKVYKNQLHILKKIYCLCNDLLIRCISKLTYQYFNYKLLSWILLLLTIVVGIVWNTYNIIAWIRQSCSSLAYIIITGKRYYTTNDDICYMIKKLGSLGTIITQDINIIQKEIESLPWIQKVSIRKQWPDTLKIHIIEHMPVALWNVSQAINVKGVIFSISKIYRDSKEGSLPILYGPSGSEQDILMYYYILNAILITSIKLQIQSIHMDVRCSWQLMLRNNMYIKLGRKNIIERLNYFVKIYPILLYKINESNKYIDYVDLRYATGFVVKWISKYDQAHTL